MNNNKYKYERLYNTLIIVSAFLFSLVIQFVTTFKETNIEKILFNMEGVTNVQATFNSLARPAVEVIISFVIISGIGLLPFMDFKFLKKDFYLNIFKKKVLIYPFSLKKWSWTLFIISLISLVFSLEIPQVIISNFNLTTLYDEYYVPYEEGMVTFPEDKRNLITIYVESFENTVLSSKNGGVNKKSYMPKMEKLTNNYINFSNNDKIGGFYQVNGTSWTIASIVGQTSGIPLFTRTKNEDNKYLEGIVNLGDILENNGYNNYFLLGSDVYFADKKYYLSEHGNYIINDYYSAIRNNWIDDDYHKWWGYEDKKLYSFAQNLLLDISNQNKPFNFTMLTADTHFFDGYVDESCPKKFDTNLANSYYCTDLMLSNFISWIQEQDFYDNTTIIIVGDHLSMRDNFFNISKDYNRTMYNLFINSYVNTNNTKNRLFSTLDMYPTTLASIGATINGDRLALGTNLFSNRDTLMEELGYDYYMKEINKKSEYYNKKILKRQD